MVNYKDFAFKVNKQTPYFASLPPAYGTVIDFRPKQGARSEKEAQTRQTRLTSVPGPDRAACKKRKRAPMDPKNSEDDCSTASKEAQVDTTSPVTGAARSVRKPQMTRPTKFRRGNVLKKQVDLDSWFTILRFSDPAQLLEMRSKIGSCYRFLRDNPMLWKHSRDFFYHGTLPDPPSMLTEFQYAHLRHGHGCMSCHTPSTRKAYWAFLRRWCKPCLHSKIIKEHEAINYLKDTNDDHLVELLNCLPAAIFDSWDNYVGVGPGNTHPQKNVYLLQDVKNLVAEYTKERVGNPATWHAESRAWMNQKAKIIQESRDFARKMEHWEEETRHSKSSDFHERKKARKDYFKEKAAEMTPPITVKELELCPSYRRAVVIPKMPNMLSWSQLKPKVQKEAADLRTQLSTPELCALLSTTPLSTPPVQHHLPSVVPPVQHHLPFFALPVQHHLSFFTPSRTITPSTDSFY